MRCAVVLRGFQVYKSVFLGWVVGRFNIAANGEHNCGVPPQIKSTETKKDIASKPVKVCSHSVAVVSPVAVALQVAAGTAGC